MKVLLLDIETAPLLADVWGLFDQNIGLNQLRDSGGLLCFSFKWLGDDEVYFFSEHENGREHMAKIAHLVLDQADAVVTWNGRKFDIPHLNREFVEMGLNPPSPFQQIDLLETVRKQFRFPSNKLQYVSTTLGFQGKVNHEGHGLWVKCMDGDEDAWRLMEEYNKQDVLLLEDLYNRLQPWIIRHPNHGINGDFVCPKCGSSRLQRRGYSRTLQSSYQRFQCLSCGGWSRDVKRTEGAIIREIAALWLAKDAGGRFGRTTGLAFVVVRSNAGVRLIDITIKPTRKRSGREEMADIERTLFQWHSLALNREHRKGGFPSP